jgi:hypothetical protein
MNRKTLLSCLVLGLVAAFGGSVRAQDIDFSAFSTLAPGDPIIGGVLNGEQFVVGVAGTAAGVNNWPPAEPPEDLINGVIGGGGEKYLNFAELNTGVIVTPNGLTGGNPTQLFAIDFWVANDAEPRDPASFELYGTNAVVSGAGPFNKSDFTLITASPLALPADRDSTADNTGFRETVIFNNTDAYTSYMLIFPTVKDAASANSMQISEVQFYGEVVPIPEPSSIVVVVMSGVALLVRRKRS